MLRAHIGRCADRMRAACCAICRVAKTASGLEGGTLEARKKIAAEKAAKKAEEAERIRKQNAEMKARIMVSPAQSVTTSWSVCRVPGVKLPDGAPYALEGPHAQMIPCAAPLRRRKARARTPRRSTRKSNRNVGV